MAWLSAARMGVKMKKFIGIILLLVLFVAGEAFAAGSCTESYGYRGKTQNLFRVTLVCTGDASDGSIPNQTLSNAVTHEIYGMYLYQVTAYPTAGGTAPDAADITVKVGNLDLLGGKGTNLLHATLTYDTFPYSTYMSMYRFPAIGSTPVVALANQGTASANFTIVLDFVK